MVAPRSSPPPIQPLATLALGAALLAGAAPASAQTTYRLGLRGGLNRALTTLDAASNFSGTYPFSGSADKSALHAWQAGLVLEASSGKWAFQPALLFTQKGEKFHTSLYSSGVAGYSIQETSSTNRYNWLEIPLNVVYTLGGDHGLQLFAGPYVALAVGGNQRGTAAGAAYYGPVYDPLPSPAVDFDDKVAYGSNSNNRRLDAGVNFGVGYRQGPLQVQLGYGLGLRNLHQYSENADFTHEFGGDAAYNRVAQLTGTYFFSL